ncbi:unnamed protein product [Linum trigynum]|uniref:PEP-utilising enzyme mobile domain-containing protein n=1 Tax=Linum trigynum TaxID=586398 RepID=A0AAV2FXQ1_9ROSI
MQTCLCYSKSSLRLEAGVEPRPLSEILVRTNTSREDIGGMHAVAGILTARGGMTSHAVPPSWLEDGKKRGQNKASWQELVRLQALHAP